MTTKPYNADLSQIERCVSTYFDTICLFVRRKLPAPLFAAINNENRGRVFADEKCTYRCVKKKWIKVRIWGWMIRIHQPTQRTLGLLSKYRPSQIDLAFDFHDKDPTQFLIQKWHTQEQVIFENTTYWGCSKKARNIASYSSKPSKITGSSCHHIELRFTSPAACRRAGINTIGDLLQLDAVKVLQHQTKLMRVELKRLDQILVGKAKCRLRHKHPQLGLERIKQHLQQLLLRALHVSEFSQISSQQLWDFRRGFRECLVAVSWEEIIGNSSMISKTPQKVMNTILTMPQEPHYEAQNQGSKDTPAPA